MSGYFSKLRSAFGGASGEKPSDQTSSKQRLLSTSSLRTAYDSGTAALKLLTPYWTQSSTKEKVWAWGLLSAAVGCIFISTDARIDYAMFMNELTNFLQAKLTGTVDPNETYGPHLTAFGKAVGKFVAASVVSFAAVNELALRWRNWMTKDYLNQWMDNKAYHRLQSIYKNTDNPDQRIHEDINRFSGASMSLMLGGLTSSITLYKFYGRLSEMSGSFNLAAVGGPDVAIPGAMAVLTIATALAGSLGIAWVGRKIAPLKYEQDRREAFFRSSLMRVKVNAEQIALNGGEKVEKTILNEKFKAAVDNSRNINFELKKLVGAQSVYGNLTIPIPYILATEFGKGSMKWGDVTETVYNFNMVLGSLSWFVDNYSYLAEWKATTDRLTSFTDAVKQSNKDVEEKKKLIDGGKSGPALSPAP